MLMMSPHYTVIVNNTFINDGYHENTKCKHIFNVTYDQNLQITCFSNYY